MIIPSPWNSNRNDSSTLTEPRTRPFEIPTLPSLASVEGTFTITLTWLTAQSIDRAPRRMCPGKEIGLSALWIAIASILHAFTIEKAVDDNGNIIEPELVYVTGFARYVPSLFTCVSAFPRVVTFSVPCFCVPRSWFCIPVLTRVMCYYRQAAPFRATYRVRSKEMEELIRSAQEARS